MNQILIGKGEHPVHLLSKYGNRHGLIAGATGTGKTVSLLVLAEGFSRLGVPVFMVDVKGDVAGLAMAGSPNEKIQQRVAQIGMGGVACEASPVLFWDVYGKSGHPVRTTISELGPTLLGRMLELSDTQTGVLEIVFKLSDDRGLLLLDLDDLKALLGLVSENRKAISAEYGLVNSQSISAIQRALLRFEREGGAAFLGEPALELADLMRTDLSGRGIINILAADQLLLKPRLYSSFLLWLLPELFETLPGGGDLESPRLVRFLTNPTCSLTTRRRRCGNGWSRWCASSAPRVSVFISVPNSPMICQVRSSASSATASSIACTPTRQETRRRFEPRQRPLPPTPGWMSPRPSPSLRWVRPLSPPSRKKASPCRLNEP